MRAHGIMLITPVNWYHTSSPMKLMIDRLVCADGGNPDPSSTHGKDARKGSLFSIVVHGDMEGAENVRRSLSGWFRFMGLIPAGIQAELDRYIGYWKPYATSHEVLDQDDAMQEAARYATLLEAVRARRSGKLVSAGENLKPPRQK